MLRRSVFGLEPVLAAVINDLPPTYYLDAQNSQLILPSIPRLNAYASSLSYALGCRSDSGADVARYITHVLHSYKRVLDATATLDGLPMQQQKVRSVMDAACTCMSALLHRSDSTYQCGTTLCPVCRAVTMVHALAFIEDHRAKRVDVPLQLTNGEYDVTRRYRPPSGTTVTLRILSSTPAGYISANYAFGAVRGRAFESVVPFAAASGVPGWLLYRMLEDPAGVLPALSALRLIGLHATARSIPRIAWAAHPSAVLRMFPEFSDPSDKRDKNGIRIIPDDYPDECDFNQAQPVA